LAPELVGVTAIVLVVEVAGAPDPVQVKLVAPGQVAVSVVESFMLIVNGAAVREHNGTGSTGAGGLTVTVTTLLPEEP
jgi:hypothetical protein